MFDSNCNVAQAAVSMVHMRFAIHVGRIFSVSNVFLSEEKCLIWEIYSRKIKIMESQRHTAYFTFFCALFAFGLSPQSERKIHNTPTNVGRDAFNFICSSESCLMKYCYGCCSIFTPYKQEKLKKKRRFRLQYEKC